MEYKTKAVIGWVLISIALAMSAYANFKCSFSCQGVYAQILNPLTVIGLVLYVGGTWLIFSKGGKNY